MANEPLLAHDFSDAELGAAWRTAIDTAQTDLAATQAHLSALRSQFYQTETEAANERDLAVRVQRLGDAVIALGQVLEAARSARAKRVEA